MTKLSINAVHLRLHKHLKGGHCVEELKFFILLTLMNLDLSSHLFYLKMQQAGYSLDCIFLEHGYSLGCILLEKVNYIPTCAKCKPCSRDKLAQTNSR